MHRKLLRPGALLLAAASAALLSACAVQMPKVYLGPFPVRMDFNCPAHNPARVFDTANDGYHDSPEGWFYKATIRQGPDERFAQAYCFYGHDMMDPAKDPAYSVHYTLVGFKATDCAVWARDFHCARDPNVHP